MQDSSIVFGNLIEPAPVRFSFTTPGWYILFGVLALLLLSGIVWGGITWKRNGYRRRAIHALGELAATSKPIVLLYESAFIVKRISIQVYGRTRIASLRGIAFTRFLNTTWKEHSFSEADAKLLDEVLYNTDTVIDTGLVNEFVNKTRRWIRKHRHGV